MEPVHEDDFGEIFVAEADTVVGPHGIRLTKASALLGYVLAQYVDGDDEEPNSLHSCGRDVRRCSTTTTQ